MRRDLAEGAGAIIGSEKIVNLAKRKNRSESIMRGKISACYDAGWSAGKIADRLNLSEKKVESMLK